MRCIKCSFVGNITEVQYLIPIGVSHMHAAVYAHACELANASIVCGQVHISTHLHWMDMNNSKGFFYITYSTHLHHTFTCH